MRSDKKPTRREGEASSNTSVCAAKTAQKTACGLLEIDSGPQRHTEQQNR